MGFLGRTLLNSWLQSPTGTQPTTQAPTQAPTPQPVSGWDWLSTQGQQMVGNVSDSVLQGLQQRYPYFGQNGALNFTKNGPWRR